MIRAQINIILFDFYSFPEFPLNPSKLYNLKIIFLSSVTHSILSNPWLPPRSPSSAPASLPFPSGTTCPKCTPQPKLPSSTRAKRSVVESPHEDQGKTSQFSSITEPLTLPWIISIPNMDSSNFCSNWIPSNQSRSKSKSEKTSKT